MAGRQDSTTGRPGQMQELQQPPDSATATQWRPARPLPRPRTTTLSLGMQEKGLQKEERQRESL
jgi:hypothetical protein